MIWLRGDDGLAGDPHGGGDVNVLVLRLLRRDDLGADLRLLTGLGETRPIPATCV